MTIYLMTRCASSHFWDNTNIRSSSMTSIARPRPSGLRAIFEYVFHKASTLLGPVAHFCRTSFSWKPMNWHKSGKVFFAIPLSVLPLIILTPNIRSFEKMQSVHCVFTHDWTGSLYLASNDPKDEGVAGAADGHRRARTINEFTPIPSSAGYKLEDARIVEFILTTRAYNDFRGGDALTQDHEAHRVPTSTHPTLCFMTRTHFWSSTLYGCQPSSSPESRIPLDNHPTTVTFAYEMPQDKYIVPRKLL
ncbi:uncharacterized protein LACBIDRAFT_323922 [Laccaria bicolor S238N-H82]|uniref:Predicted protein n=1 Tax=Laccaria bicolor (strain S238N-H82 / ATCC MYA-4686) TaxID=486041 RepID=B0D028_LACBS|nr:uncharacterized protein LACBIDRAFT_323922 [Laccaria bicolor S238N-H82]EDR11383.1 predicted protein [Laccaria bicolor S238N-H82]|eukprot:XP_001877280.1 predicted protein [Laccaria bicolor S238N-H82]